MGIDGSYYQLTRDDTTVEPRYTNEDQTVVFWELQGEMFLGIGDDIYTIPVLVETEVETLSIEAEPVTCTDSASGGMCLLINGAEFSDEIEGFTYEPGTFYTITVAKTEVPHPPTGYAPHRYQLLEVLEANSTQPVDQSVMHPSWDIDEDGINDCEEEGTCDDTVDYTEPRPSSSPLEAHSWKWEYTEYDDGTIIDPNSEEFIATFSAPNEFTSQTDCNGVFGSYQTSGAILTFSTSAATEMYCEGEMYEQKYTQMISQVISYRLDTENHLVLVTEDGGSMVFSQHQQLISDFDA